MPKEKVAVIDGGGRGAVLADKYLQSRHVEGLIAIPGNDMMKLHAPKPVKTFPHVKTTDVPAIVALCRTEGVTFVDVVQDNAIGAGLVDALEKEGIRALGPRKAAGRIEWDKVWARRFGDVIGLPQPFYAAFDSSASGMAAALAHISHSARDTPGRSWFVKAAYLCEGKGALPAENAPRAEQRIREVAAFKNGAGRDFLIEDWLKNDNGTNGEEFSAFALSSGPAHAIIGYAQDYKRSGNSDTGENTGGMGCSSPPLVLTPKIMGDAGSIIGKTIEGLAAQGIQYRGILYLGAILIRENGVLKTYVVEFNARWGDPEAQVIVPGIKNDMLELGVAAMEDRLGSLGFATDGKSRVVVAGVSRGYPGNYDAVRGKQVFGLEAAMEAPGVRIFGAGVKVEDGRYYANGGRLFYVVGEGDNVLQAKTHAYNAMLRVSVEGDNLDWRDDIAYRDLERFMRP